MRAGFTLLELLIVIAIIGIFMALGVPMLRPPSSYLFANDLKVMIQQARFESIKRNIPVAVVWNSTDKTFTTQFHPTNPDVSQACSLTGTTTLRTKSLADYRRVSVKTAFQRNGLVWLPTGLGQKCDGGAMMDSTEVTDGRTAYKVLASSAGRIKIEKQRQP